MPQEAACDWSSPAGGATLARGEHSQNGVHRHTLGENNLVGFTPKNGIQHGVILGKPVIDSQITNETIRKCFTELAAEIQTDGLEGAPGHGQLSRPLQRKLYSLVTCQLCGGRDGRARAQRAARSMGERAVTELILLHQDPHQLSSNLWAAVRARGCQFLGPAMQDEALKLILLALEDGSSLSRKVLVHFVVQNLAAQHPVVSKTSVGHVVQLMYRASCFVVMKRSEESSLMQLKEELRTFPALRRQHDSQLVKIASEAGLRISPEQWSSLLYGDAAHKSHMQSIIDKLQTHDWFSQGVTELTLTLQRSGDTEHLLTLQPDLLYLSELPAEAETVTEAELETAVLAVHRIVRTLTTITRVVRTRRQETTSLKNPKYKTTLCRDVMKKGACPRGSACAFAHSNEELEIYCQLARRPQHHLPSSLYVPQVSSASLSLADTAALQRVHAAARGRGEGLGGPGGRDANSLLQQQALQQALYPHSDSSSVQDTGHERTALTHIVFSQLASSPLSATRGASPLSATTLQQRGTSPPNGLKQRPYAAQLHVGYYNPTTLAARQATLGLSDSDR